MQIPILPPSIQLVAASKGQPTHIIEEAFALGITQFGENRVEEAAAKIAQLPPELLQETVWHLIGHLQSNKVRPAVEIFDWIDSVHTLELAQKISETTTELFTSVTILVQVNISGEKSKSGFAAANWQKDPEQYKTFAKALLAIHDLPNIELKGLMTIAPEVQEPNEIRPYFHSLKLLQQQLLRDFPQLDLAVLSMGMTNDYEVAIEEGATMVRLGRAIFS